MVATLVAFPVSVLIARNITPFPRLALLLRGTVNAFRAIDTVVFAILFVAAVGLGPFAGVLGMIVHSIGVIAKLNREAISKPFRRPRSKLQPCPAPTAPKWLPTRCFPPCCPIWPR